MILEILQSKSHKICRKRSVKGYFTSIVCKVWQEVLRKKQMQKIKAKIKYARIKVDKLLESAKILGGKT